MVMIYTNYDGPESSMLDTNFHLNRSTGSREEDFLRFLSYMGMVANSVM